MSTYKVPVTWREHGYLIIKAEGIPEAIANAHDAGLPSDSEYLEGSFEIDYDNIKCIDDEIKKYSNELKK
jgi:hypothetical protein